MLNRLTDIFSSLERHRVRYLVIGGIAVVLHGVPRATFDLDILVDATPENARRLLDGLMEVGLGTASLINPEELLSNVITVFKDKVRIDVQTATPGLDFTRAWDRREIMTYHGQEFPVLSKEDLIASKKASARPVDLEDVRMLELPAGNDPQPL